MSREIVCDLSVFTPEERQRHAANSEAIFNAAQEKHEVENGYAFRLPLAFWSEVAEFVRQESRCCPFFDFTLQLHHDGAVWLTMAGDEAVKAYLEAEMGKG